MRTPVYSKLIVAGFILTSLGIISRVSIRWPIIEEKYTQGDNWVSWEPGRCLDWSPLTLGLFLLGSLMTSCGMSFLGQQVRPFESHRIWIVVRRLGSHCIS